MTCAFVRVYILAVDAYIFMYLCDLVSIYIVITVYLGDFNE